MTKRAEYTHALYEGSLAEPGDRNPYNGTSLVLAKLWMRGYMRMLRVRVNTGPAMQTYLKARRERASAVTDIRRNLRRARTAQPRGTCCDGQ